MARVLTAIFVMTILVISSQSFLLQVRAAPPTDTYAVGWDGPAIDQLNPMLLTEYDGGAYMINHAIYDVLVQSDLSGNPTPDLADSWTWTDPQTLVLNLVHNATWHDGTPFTAQDAEFTINLMLQYGTSFPLESTYIWNVKSVKALDNYTLQIGLKTPDAVFLDGDLVMMYILPKHIWQNVANVTAYPNDHPIGTGPFKFVSWEPNSFVQLDANPDYFRGPPHVNHLAFRYFSSVNAEVLALQSGEIDATGPILPPTVVPTLTANPGIQVISKPDLRYFYLNFNGFVNGTGNPTLRDERVRRALAYAVDKKTLAQTIWLGFADVLNTIVPTSLGKWHNPNTPDTPFNLTEAATMLDDAGYKVGPDGIRASPSGVKMVYKLDVPSSYPEELRAAQLVSGWWGSINVKAIPELLDAGTLGNDIYYWKHDTFIWVWSSTSTDPNDYLEDFLTSQICVPGCYSDSGFSNATYDKLYAQETQTTDPVQRQKIVWEMQDILAAHVPYVPLYNDYAIQGFRSDLFTGIPEGTIPPVSFFAGNTLFMNIRPITQPTTQTAQTTTSVTSEAGVSTTTIAAAAVILVVVALLAVLVSRRRRPAPTTKS